MIKHQSFGHLTDCLRLTKTRNERKFTFFKIKNDRIMDNVGERSENRMSRLCPSKADIFPHGVERNGALWFRQARRLAEL